MSLCATRRRRLTADLFPAESRRAFFSLRAMPPFAAYFSPCAMPLSRKQRAAP